MHRRIGDVLHVHRNVPVKMFYLEIILYAALGNVPFPDPETFVVRRCHEASVVVDECDRIHSTQMPVVLLYHISCPCIPLKNIVFFRKKKLVLFGNTHTNDFFVRRASNEEMLFFSQWMELDTIGNFSTAKPPLHPSSFRVPQFDVSVVA